MNSSDVIKILLLTLVISLYLGFIIRLIRSNSKKVLLNAFKISNKMVITPFVIPLLLLYLKRKLDHNRDDVRKSINNTIAQQLKINNLPEELHAQIYAQVIQRISTPMFFINTSIKLIINYFKEWDKNVDILINEKAKSQIPIKHQASELPLAIDIFRIIVESMSKNKIFHLKPVK